LGRVAGRGDRETAGGGVNSIVFLIPIAVGLAAVFLFLFLRAVRDGQFDDLDDPPKRILKDD
jgi:cbb3-type cytochrome oxidase maturation protein